jgi:hypothetical protein
MSLALPGWVLLEANTVPTFDALCRAIARELGISTDVQSETTEDGRVLEAGAKAIVHGNVTATHKVTTARQGQGSRPLTPYDLRKLLEAHERPSVIALDEMDTLDQRSDILPNLAALGKSLSNRGWTFPHRFIFLGVGRSAQALLGQHKSAFRGLKEVYLPPLNEQDIYDFIVRAEHEIGITIPDAIKRGMAEESLGFPYYAHEVGFHSLKQHEQAGGIGPLTLEHYFAGRRDAADAAFAHLLERYKFTVYRLSELEAAILREVVWGIGQTKEAIDGRLEKRLVSGPQTLLSAWESLQAKGYLWVRKADARISLQEPLARPFLRIKVGRPASKGRRTAPPDQLGFDFGSANQG